MPDTLKVLVNSEPEACRIVTNVQLPFDFSCKREEFFILSVWTVGKVHRRKTEKKPVGLPTSKLLHHFLGYSPATFSQCLESTYELFTHLSW